jgi:uncharacterized protein
MRVASRWEALCKRCGMCCYEKRWTRDGYIIDLSAPCPYLDTSDLKCSVYHNRFRVCHQCRKMTIFHALFTSYLPDTCGYVERFRIWRKSSTNRRRR